MDRASGTERVVVLAETRSEDAAQQQALKRRINDLALSLLGGPVDDIVSRRRTPCPRLQRQDPARCGARLLRARPSAVRLQAVWLQLLRLAAAGVVPQMRRGWRVVRGLLFSARAYLVFRR